MSNLIITVISIALVAVIALAGAVYVGQSFFQSSAQARAAMLISQSRQLLNANTQYMLDKGYSTFNDFGADAPVIAGYTAGRIPILSLDALGMTGGSNTFYYPLNSAAARHIACGPGNGFTTATADVLDGYYVALARAHGNIFGNNSIIYDMWALTGSLCNTTSTAIDFSLASASNHPLVMMCKAINQLMPPPAGLTYSASGLPLSTVAGTKVFAAPFWTDYLNDPTEVNYCFIGPNASWGTGNVEMFFVMTN